MRQTKLLLATIATLWCSLTASAHDFKVGGVYYNITSETDLTVEVTYQGNFYDEYSNEYSGTITIPSVVTYNGKTYSVTEIGFAAFANCSSLTVLKIPENITRIGNGAFAYCSSLRSINIPEGVTAINSQVFQGCSSLTSITIPESVTSIGDYAFMSCSSLTAITIPKGVTSIGLQAFCFCSSLTSITIPEGVTSIGNYAFSGCSSLTSIIVEEGNTTYDSRDNCNAIIETSSNCLIVGSSTTIIPESVTSIGFYAFYGCSSLTAITIPESVTSIGDNAFYGCSSLTSITIPESVTSIGDYAFMSCSSLTAITIPKGVTSIGLQAFCFCSSLISITIPEGVTSIGNYAFSGCSSLTSIIVEEGNTTYDSRDNCNAIIETSSNCLIVGSSTTIIPESVTSIGFYAFYGCSSLTAITIPESVTSIGDNAFYGCSSLTSITIPEGVTSIGDEAFYGCSSLYIVINNSSLLLSKGSNSYGYVAYYAKVVYQGGKMSTINDFQFYTSNGIHTLINYIGEDTEIKSPDSYNGESYSIGNYAFYGCSSITSLAIPKSVEVIGYSAFSGCSSLTAVHIKDIASWCNISFSDAESNPLYYAKNLYLNGELVTELTIPNTVTAIKRYAFYNCSSLTSITIPESVTSIGDEAFYGCSSLYKVINCSNLGISKGSTAYGYVAYYAKKVLNGSNLSTIGDYQFYTSNGVHYLANYSGNDSDLVLPDSYNGENYKIDEYAFSGCSSLTSVTIPEGVTSIGNYAFNGCTSLKELVIADGNETLSLGYNEYYYNGTGRGLFDHCPLEIVYWGRNLGYGSSGSYGYSPFYNQKALSSVTIGDSVTSIGDYAFYNCSLTSITLSEGVKSIGSHAFDQCHSLTSITIPASVTSIGSKTFQGCTSLKELVIEDGNETLSLGYNEYYSNKIGKSLFYDCPLETVYWGRNLSYSSGGSYGYSPFYGQNALTSVTIGESVTSIGVDAFRLNHSLTSITIPASVTSIGDYAFYNCSLTSITLSEGVKSIGSHAFDQCHSLTSITLPEGVKSIGYMAFHMCYSLTSITIPKSVTSFGYYAFWGCSGELTINCNIPSASLCEYGVFYNSEFTKVTIGKGVTSIGEYAFYNCSRLTSITIPESVTSIGDWAFRDCESLTAVHIKDIASWCNISFSDAESNPLYYAKNLYLNGELVTELTIPHTVTAIKRYAFYNCSLTSITIPESVTSIGESTFRGCSSLISITIPESVTSIGWDAFRGCSSLISITIPESVKSIGGNAFSGCGGELTINCNIPSASQSDNGVFYKSEFTKVTIGEGVKIIGKYAFYGCSSITSLAIPKSVTSIGYEAFYGCNSLTAVHIKDIASWCNISFSDAESNPLYYAKNLYLNGELVTELTIPNTVTAIKRYAFYNCSSLTSITIPESVTSIGNDAFYNSSSLTSITIPESVTSIGDWAFYGCSSLYMVINNSSLLLSRGSNSHGYVAYYAKVVYQGGKMSTINDFQFYTSNGIHTLINYIGEDTEIKSPDSYNGESYSIGNYAFYGCSNLTSLTIPESVTSIGNYAFYGCSNLTSLTIPESVTSIGDNAFIGCSNVENLVVKGSAMPHVPSDKLKKIVLYSPAPLQSKGFSSTVYQNCMLYVPQEGLARYQVVEPWAYFWNIIAFDTSDIAPAVLPEDNSDPIIYDLRGQRVDVPTRGNIYIVNGRKVLY